MEADEMESYTFTEGMKALGIMSRIERKFHPNWTLKTEECLSLCTEDFTSVCNCLSPLLVYLIQQYKLPA